MISSNIQLTQSKGLGEFRGKKKNMTLISSMYTGLIEKKSSHDITGENSDCFQQE